MPVLFLTIHAYRSWNANRPQGYVRRGRGILPPDEATAKAYDRNATAAPASFGPNDHRSIASIVADACQRRAWRLHALAAEPTHVHLLLIWMDDTRSTAVCGKLKNLIGRELNLNRDPKRRWLSRGASRKRIKDRRHFDCLVEPYLPNHSGLFWTEGMARLPPPASAGG